MKNSKNVKGKQILLSALVALVLIAGYYRWSIDSGKAVQVSGDAIPKIDVADKGKASDNKSNNPEKEGESKDEMGYFEKSRYERELSRSNTLSMAEDTDDKEIKEKISAEMKKNEKENIIESLIKAKGFEDCIVFFDDSGVSVVVKCDKLDSKSVNQIKDIVISKTNCKASDIRISSKKN